MNKELEIRRKFFHLLFGIILATLIYYGYIDKWILGLFTVIAALFLIIASRMKFKFFEWMLDNFERAKDRKFFPGKGPLFYLIGAELSLIFFTKDIALASIVILAIGDSVPNLVGMYFGEIKNPFSDKKFLEGAIIGIILSALAAHIFVTWYEALVAAIVALFFEGIDMKIGFEKIDDNLVVPLSAGIVITLIRFII
jgi:dolichol kinase